MKISGLRAALLIAGIWCAGNSYASSYSLTFLTSPNDDHDHSLGAVSINDARQIAATMPTGDRWPPFDSGTAHAAIWSGGHLTDLSSGYPDVMYNSYATGINKSGQISGFAGYQVNDWELGRQAVIWHGNSATVLGSLGGTDSQAHGINNAGIAVGSSATADNAVHATVWNGIAATDLNAMNPGLGYSSAESINNNGQIVGLGDIGAQNYRALRWDNGIATILGQPADSTYSYAIDINDSNQTVGTYKDAAGHSHAALWTGNSFTALGGNGEVAYSINNAGTIVGLSFDQSVGFYAAMWVGGVETDLNQYLSPADRAAGWVLLSAHDINGRGDIVGEARNPITQESKAFVLSVSAVPEPETYAMLLGGLAMVAWVARRRKAA